MSMKAHLSDHLFTENLKLVGCDRGHVIFSVGSLSLYCVRVTQTSGCYLSCELSLPDATSNDTIEAIKNRIQPWIYQILNGVVMVYDPDVNMMCIL